MSGITQIGRCIGCAKGPRKLDKGVCEGCLNHPKRGRKWAEMSNRIRTDATFALQAYNSIGAEKPERETAGKLLFIRMYGLPAGAVSPLEERKANLKKVVDQDIEGLDGDEDGPQRLMQQVLGARPTLRLVR